MLTRLLHYSPKMSGHPITFGCKITVGRRKHCLEICQALERITLSRVIYSELSFNIPKIFGVVSFTFFITKISQYNTSSNVLKNKIKAIMTEQGLWMSL